MAPGSAHRVACRLSVYYQPGVLKHLSCTKITFGMLLGLDSRSRIVGMRMCLGGTTCVLASVLPVDSMRDLG
jgi:hypothetical protein